MLRDYYIPIDLNSFMFNFYGNTYTEENEREGLINIKVFFPALKADDAGYFESLEEIKEFLEIYSYETQKMAEAMLTLDLNIKFTFKMRDKLYNAISTYIKVSDKPIYKELLKKLNE